MKVRASGVLLHITSLPGPHGVGDLGPQAFRFVDFLAELNQSYWQILPLGPTSPAIGSSPYSSFSAFAGNPLLISMEFLAHEGLIGHDQLGGFPRHDARRAVYEAAEPYKEAILRACFQAHRQDIDHWTGYRTFLARNLNWLEDFALFTVIKQRHGGAAWTDWEPALRDHEEGALGQLRREMAEEIAYVYFTQYLFAAQWKSLKRYANARGIAMVGDVPIYVTFDSADVWASPRLFKLDEARQPTHVAGVPPDYFSETGQLWGNPVYAWEEHEGENFAWWAQRMGRNLERYDWIRLDHFRGFEAYWEVKAGAKTAIDGEWVEALGDKLFDSLLRRFPSLPLIAEDLGVITPAVRELKDKYAFPGMKIQMFAFGPGVDVNPDSQHNHVRNCVAYVGTHDNNTARGWYEEETTEEDRRRLRIYIGHDVMPERVPMDLLRLTMASTANTSIVAMQDLLGLDSAHRMNTPSVPTGNWAWRMLPEEMDAGRFWEFKLWTEFFGRAQHNPEADPADPALRPFGSRVR